MTQEEPIQIDTESDDDTSLASLFPTATRDQILGKRSLHPNASDQVDSHAKKSKVSTVETSKQPGSFFLWSPI